MRAITLAMAMIVGGATVGHAYDDAECGEIQDQWATLLDQHLGLEITAGPTTTFTATPEGCSATDLEIYVEATGQELRLGVLSYAAPDLREWLRGEVILPATLRLTFESLYQAAPPGLDAATAWGFEVANRHNAAHGIIDWTWDEATQGLAIARFDIDLAYDSALSMTLAGRAFGWEPYDMPFARFGVTSVQIDLSNGGLFQTSFATALAISVTRGGAVSVEDGLTDFRRATRQLAMVLPPSFLSAESLAALFEVVDALPNPDGDLTLTLTSETPVRLQQFGERLRQGIPPAAAMPEGARIGAIWTPAAR